MSNFYFQNNDLAKRLYSNSMSLMSSNNVNYNRLKMTKMGTSNRTTDSIVGFSRNNKGSIRRVFDYLARQQNILKTNGVLINLTQTLTMLARFFDVSSYGANSTVEYLCPYYPGYTQVINNIPVINLQPNNFILFEFTITNDWLENHNLFVFTPYFYSYNDISGSTINNYTIFGSTDQSMFFTKSSLINNKIKVCCTSSIDIANTFSNLGYYISKIPYEYISLTNYSILIRIGTLGQLDPNVVINQYMKTSIYTVVDTTLLTYYNSNQIISSFPPVYPPVSSSSAQTNINIFNQLLSQFPSLINSTNPPYILYNYLSNYVVPPVDNAIESFYDSVGLQNLTPPRSPINIQANNTCENYYLSNIIPTVSGQQYLYIVYLNQYLSGAGITSNIQIYDSVSHNIIPNGTIETASDLSAMSQPNYPFPSQSEISQFAPYGIFGYPMASLYFDTSGGSLIITERICYGQQNFNHVIYDDVNTAQIFIGNPLTQQQITNLQNTYNNINVTILE
jgi:hypothetical protein